MANVHEFLNHGIYQLPYSILFLFLIVGIGLYLTASVFNSSESGAVELCASGLCYVSCFIVLVCTTGTLMIRGVADVTKSYKQYQNHTKQIALDALGGEENLEYFSNELKTNHVLDIDQTVEDMKIMTMNLSEQELDLLTLGE